MTIIELHPTQSGTMQHRVPLAAERLRRAKRSYATHVADLALAQQLLIGDWRPNAGDLLLARIDRIGQHRRLELPCGRRAHLHQGDEVIVCYGNRYAPDQFEAFVPDHSGSCDLVAAGGIAAVCRSRHTRIKAPTRITPIGLLADVHGQVMNLSAGLADVTPFKPPKRLFAVVGTMMNAGKTTAAGMLVRGLRRSGVRVGAAKVTGTGAGCDRWFLTDTGADAVVDFTDLGAPSTFGLSHAQVWSLLQRAISQLVEQGMEQVVIEIADGLFQRETAALLRDPRLLKLLDGVLFAANDALGAEAGVRHLQGLGHRVLAVSGAMTASPLATEEARQILDLPVLTADQLATAEFDWTTDRQFATRTVQ